MLKNIEKQSDYDEFKNLFASFIQREHLEIFCNDGNESSFSHSNCECCGRPLGGDRYRMIGITHSEYGSESFFYEVCADCLYYNEYGQLDDMTMLDYDLE